MNARPPGQPAVVLLVEDNDDDVELTRIGFEQAGAAVRIHAVPNGEECMLFLRRQGEYAAAPTPDIVLLDMNMSRMDGREVLEAVNADAGLRHLPIIVMTSSNAPRDVLECYQLRCSSYIVKPLEFDSFVRIVQSIAEYWLACVCLPPNPKR